MCYTDDEKVVWFLQIKHFEFHYSSPHVAITPGLYTFQCLCPSKKTRWRRFCLSILFIFLWGGSSLEALHFFPGRCQSLRYRPIFPSPTGIKFGVTGRFLTKSFRYKFIQSRCKKFYVFGLKNEEHSPQMCKLYLKWSKFSCNLSAWGRIWTTCMEMTLKRKKQIANSQHCSLLWYHFL